jgi:hypothetical protein
MELVEFSSTQGASSAVQITEYRCKYVSKKVIVGTGQYFDCTDGFDTYKERIGSNLIPVTISQ